MRFRQFFIKEAFENWVYDIPKDPEERMYDFYFFSLWGAQKQEIYDEEFINAFERGRTKCFEYLKKILLYDVYVAINMEMTHFSNHLIEPVNKEKYNNILKKWEEAYKNKEFVNAVKYARIGFDEFKWEELYGGIVWINICDAWSKLAQAKELNNIMVSIDHILDLEHNTGVLFHNKISDWAKYGNWEWIKDVLDFKQKATPDELLERCSTSLKQIGYAFLKYLLGSTAEQRGKETYDSEIEAIKKNPANIRYIKNPNEELQRAAIDRDIRVIVYLKNPSSDIQQYVVGKIPELLEFIEKPTEEAQKIAVQKEPQTIRYIKNPSEDIQIAAVKKDENIFELIQEPSPKVIQYINSRRKKQQVNV